MKNTISIAISIQAITECFPVITELRPHLKLADFITQVQRQQQEFNYQLVYLQVGKTIQAVAGFRISESLAWGRFLYIDDLVSKSDHRSQGYGTILFDWLIDHAQTKNCQQLTHGFWGAKICSASLLPATTDEYYQSSLHDRIK